jgi:hypothetical protein
MEPINVKDFLKNLRSDKEEDVQTIFSRLLRTNKKPTRIKATEWLINGYMPEGHSVKIGHTASRKTSSNVGEIGAMLGIVHPESVNVKVRDTRKIIYFTEDCDQFNNMVCTYLSECGVSDERIAEVFANDLFVYDLFENDDNFVKALQLLIEHLTVEKPTIDGLGTYKVQPVIYFDTMRFCFDITDENSNSNISVITKIIKSMGCSTVTVHHTGKSAEGEAGLQRGRGSFNEGTIVHGSGASSLVSNLEASFVASWDLDLNSPRIVANKKRQHRPLEVCVVAGRPVTKDALSRNGEWVPEQIWFPILQLYSLEEYNELRAKGSEDKDAAIHGKLATRFKNLLDNGVTQIEFQIGSCRKETSEVSKAFAKSPFCKDYKIADASYAGLRDWLFMVADCEHPKSGIGVLDIAKFVSNVDRYLSKDF